MITGDYRWVQVSTGEYWWVLVITGEYRWVLLSTVEYWGEEVNRSEFRWLRPQRVGAFLLSLQPSPTSPYHSHEDPPWLHLDTASVTDTVSHRELNNNISLLHRIRRLDPLSWLIYDTKAQTMKFWELQKIRILYIYVLWSWPQHTISQHLEGGCTCVPVCSHVSCYSEM